jgi:hypothetical protein
MPGGVGCRGDQRCPRVGRWELGVYHQVIGLGFGSQGFDTRGCFLIGFNRSHLSGCCRFRHRLFRLGRVPGCCRVLELRSLRDRLRSWSGTLVRNVGFDNSPPSDDVAPPFAQVQLLGRGSGPLSFRGGRVANGSALMTLLGCPLYKSRLRFFPLYTATVIRRVVSPAATALRLSPRGRASTGELEAPTRDAPGCVSAVTLRVSEALAAFTLQWPLWRHVRLHRHSQTAELVDRSDLGHPWAPRH